MLHLIFSKKLFILGSEVVESVVLAVLTLTHTRTCNECTAPYINKPDLGPDIVWLITSWDAGSWKGLWCHSQLRVACLTLDFKSQNKVEKFANNFIKTANFHYHGTCDLEPRIFNYFGPNPKALHDFHLCQGSKKSWNLTESGSSYWFRPITSHYRYIFCTDILLWYTKIRNEKQINAKFWTIFPLPQRNFVAIHGSVGSGLTMGRRGICPRSSK